MTPPPGEADRRDRVTDGAISAIALHADAAADASLERLRRTAPAGARPARRCRSGSATRAAAAASRSCAGSSRTIRARRSARRRCSASRRAGSRRPSTTLIDSARSNADASGPRRSDLLARPEGRQQGGGGDHRAIEQDPDTDVKKRAVFALSQLPKDEGVPLLINVARTNSQPGGAQAGDVLARPVEGSAGARVLRGGPEVDALTPNSEAVLKTVLRGQFSEL